MVGGKITHGDTDSFAVQFSSANLVFTADERKMQHGNGNTANAATLPREPASYQGNKSKIILLSPTANQIIDKRIKPKRRAMPASAWWWWFC